MKLVIVESPTKAKTITRFLDSSFKVESSLGHVRDLPENEMGVDIKNNFRPHYIILPKAKKVVAHLKANAQKAQEIYFATDEDREGEAIAWHLVEILKPPKEKIKRITFDELTEEALKEALKKPRFIDLNLVNAQQARRILDRLVGYELSPFLWKKITSGLSAGRVQSVALRLIVEREEAIEKFKPQEYWLIEAEFLKEDKTSFSATLYKIKEKILNKLDIKTKKEAQNIEREIKERNFAVSHLTKKRVLKNPPPPFTTSTLQQEANRKLGFSTKKTMFLAQQLYEGVELGAEGPVGLITYMRTDSVHLSDRFLKQAQEFLKDNFGEKYTLAKPRIYKTKSKLAQEAHEAIRPTNLEFTPQKIKDHLAPDQYKLYELIWRRSLATQMPAALWENVNVEIESQDKKYTFKAVGNTLIFEGFLKIWKDSAQQKILPPLVIKEKLDLKKVVLEQKFTQPPPRYSEASLVKELEKRGIGRPSTYAPTITTLFERRYIEKENRKLKPTDLGKLVTRVLIKHFPEIVDYNFTARMEDELDLIAQGKKDWVGSLKKFYIPFKENLIQKFKEVSKKELIEEVTKEKCPKCGRNLIIKQGRFGRFLACSGFPKCKFTKNLNNQENQSITNEKCPLCGSLLVKRKSRYGYFLACSRFPKCDYKKDLSNNLKIPCPKCRKGEIVKRLTKNKKIFYACNQYPECDFVLWQKPSGKICPKCGYPLIYAAKDKLKCSNSECSS